MCFAPQRRALFRHLNFYKCSEAEVSCAFWLRNLLRATMACNFSFLIWPDGSAPAALASLFFDPPEPQIIGKTQCFETFLPFRAPASSSFWLFLLTLSSDSFSSLIFSLLLFSSLLWLLPPLLFHLSILSEVWLRNFGHCTHDVVNDFNCGVPTHGNFPFLQILGPLNGPFRLQVAEISLRFHRYKARRGIELPWLIKTIGLEFCYRNHHKIESQILLN